MDYKKVIKILSQSRKSISNNVKVSERTVNRWARDESKPKPCNITDFKKYITQLIQELTRIRNQ